MQLATGDLEASRDTTTYEGDPDHKPERIVIFGKGGIGKSTVAANLSAIYARRFEKRVLHIGCDPKADSSSLIVERERMSPVLKPTGEKFNLPTIEEMIVDSRLGVDCLEAGGPTPGVGCGGRGVSLVLQLLMKEKLIPKRGYDPILFDVLGDVVCGGFAAPLRKEFGEKVVIVMSEELMALYAANNIARAVEAYWDNGVRLVGLIANCKDPKADKSAIHRFARMINTRVLAFIPRDPLVRDAEFQGRTLVEVAPEARITQLFEALAREIYESDVGSMRKPTPLSNDEFYEVSRAEFPEEDLLRMRRDRGETIESDEPEPDAVGSKTTFTILTGDLATKAKSTGGCGTTSESSGGGCKTKGCGTQRGTAEQVDGKPIPGVRRPPADEFEKQHSLFEVWLPDRRWREFFCDEELSLNIMRSDMDNLALVAHEELECHYVNATTQDGTMSFVNYPWKDFTSPGGSSTHSRMRQKNNVMYVTDIGDEEIVMGGAPRLKQVLKQIDEDERQTDLIMLYGSCPPTINGDDHFGIQGAFTQRSEIPIVHMDNSMDQTRDYFVAIFRMFMQSPEYLANIAGREDGLGRTINLVGFPKDTTYVELLALLGAIGVEVNATILPDFDLHGIKAFPKAALTVLRDHISYQLVYDTVCVEAAEDFGMRYETPKAPYGINTTVAWVAAIAKALEMDEAEWRPVLEARRKAIQPRWDAVRERASQHRMAFVADKRRVKRLNEGKYSFGIPMIDVLREASFGIELFCYCDVCDGAQGRHKVHSAPGPGGTRVRYFHDEAELTALLEDPDIGAVYSEIYYDYRLSRAGKSQFHLGMFEAGFEGAVRTIENLLGLCELPFFRKYQRFLRPG